MEKKLTKKELLRRLYKTKNTHTFLRKHKCLHSFTRQLKLTNKNSEQIKKLYEAILKDDTTDILYRAFLWEETTEGKEFWINLVIISETHEHIIS